MIGNCSNICYDDDEEEDNKDDGDDDDVPSTCCYQDPLSTPQGLVQQRGLICWHIRPGENGQHFAGQKLFLMFSNYMLNLDHNE